MFTEPKDLLHLVKSPCRLFLSPKPLLAPTLSSYIWVRWMKEPSLVEPSANAKPTCPPPPPVREEISQNYPEVDPRRDPTVPGNGEVGYSSFVIQGLHVSPQPSSSQAPTPGEGFVHPLGGCLHSEAPRAKGLLRRIMP